MTRIKYIAIFQYLTHMLAKNKVGKVRKIVLKVFLANYFGNTFPY